jgi:hypothetical protein
MKTLSHLLLILLLPVCALAQDYKRTYNWYFGDSVGINFNNSPPSVLTNGVLRSWQGCSSISDSNGFLQLYTNGQTVWNMNHRVIPNGTGLKGNISSTQAALIIPIPDNDTLFYIFTTDVATQSNGLMYSIVNIAANNGEGAVIEKNIILKTPICEKLTAVYHANGKDVWVAAHEFGNNSFRVYLITNKGLIDCPVISNVGSSIDTYIGNAQGEIKFSRDSKKIYSTIYTGNKIEILEFDNSTGKISDNNILTLNNIVQPYSIELSPNMKRLYVTDKGKNLFQYNMELGVESLINSNRYTVYSQSKDFFFNSVQIGPDNKIYIAVYDSTFISAVHNPDSVGSSANFQLMGINLNGKKCLAGLPNFISSYFHRPNIDFNYQVSCSSLAALLTGRFETNPSNITWQIKRISNGVTTSYTTQNVSHIFPDSGNYEVRLIVNNDTVTKIIFIDAPILPQADNLGCGTDSVVLSIPSSYRCIQWKDTSALLYSRTIKTNGTFSIQAYNSNGCLIRDSIKIQFSPLPAKPVITKVNDSLKSTQSYAYQWLLNDTAIAGANTQNIKPLVAGLYKVVITDNNGCSNVSTPYSSNVGAGELSSDAIKIYPNPATTSLTIEFANTVYDLSITDVTGRIVFTQTSITNSPLQINCKSFQKGIYLIHIKTLNNTYRKKLIIQ